MANKKTKTKPQSKRAEDRDVSRNTRILQIILVIFSIILILSMILSAVST